MTDSYATEKKIEHLVTNDVHPSMTTIDILASLKSINHFEKEFKGKSVDDLTGSELLAKNELKYLTMGSKAVGKDGLWKDRFGGGLQGAMAMAELLKARESERITKLLLDEQLEESGSKLAEAAKKVNRGKAVNINP